MHKEKTICILRQTLVSFKHLKVKVSNTVRFLVGNSTIFRLTDQESLMSVKYHISSIREYLRQKICFITKYW